MDIFFQDPSEIPLPPDEVRIRQFYAEPWPDGRRVRVFLELTPFQKHPNGEISVIDTQGEEVANLSIIETIDPKMEFTIHLRMPTPHGRYQVSAKVFYPDLEKDEQGAGELQNEQTGEFIPRKITIVDQAETTFEILAEKG